MAKPVISGADALRRYIEECGLPYFRILASESDGNKGSLATNFDSENQTVHDVIRQVNNYLERIRYYGGDFVLWLSSKPKTSVPEYRQLVQIPGEATPMGAAIGSVNPQNIEERIQAGITAALDRYKQEQKIADLEAKVIALEREKKENEPGAFERVIGRVEPYIQPFLDSAFPNRKQISGAQPAKPANQENSNEMDEDEQKRAEVALRELYDSEPDATSVLENIVKLSKENPDMYRMAKNYLGL